MSILIKGMEMPVNCKTCPFIRNEYGLEEYEEIYYCRCSLTQMPPKNPAFARSKNCPLVEIPPHGRLIDADALAQDLEEDVEMISRVLDIGDLVGAVRDDQQFQKDCKQNCMWYLTESPTIIEAEVDDG